MYKRQILCLRFGVGSLTNPPVRSTCTCTTVHVYKIEIIYIIYVIFAMFSRCVVLFLHASSHIPLSFFPQFLPAILTHMRFQQEYSSTFRKVLPTTT
jgi:hypothetical protein